MAHRSCSYKKPLSTRDGPCRPRFRRMSEMSFITQARVRRTMADDWHSLPADAVLKRLDASPLGLDAEEAARRLARFGANELVQTARVNPLRILLSQFVDVLVIVLIIAAIISAALGLLQGENADLYDAVLIIVIVVMNAILGFVQEYRAERSLEALKNLAAPKAHILREGGIVAVPSRELVPGDVAVLTAGDRIPADARLFEVASLRVNEASLTGESLPVSKAVEALPAILSWATARTWCSWGPRSTGAAARRSSSRPGWRPSSARSPGSSSRRRRRRRRSRSSWTASGGRSGSRSCLPRGSSSSSASSGTRVTSSFSS